MGRRRPHKPTTSRFDSCLRYEFYNGLLDQSGGRLPRTQESGERSPGSPPISINSGKVGSAGAIAHSIGEKRNLHSRVSGNPVSLISLLIVVRVHVPQPFSRVPSHVKIVSCP